MTPVGGYFSLELPLHEEYHKDAIKLNTGRNCLEYILRCRKYTKVYIPYYTCEVILEPFKKLGLEYVFYHINLQFEIEDEILLQENEAFLYINYYGLKQNYVEELAAKFGHQLIVDNTQAFFARPIAGIDTFYTCRKFFGVPDGAYLYTDKKLDIELEQDVSYERMTFLTKRIDLGAEKGYQDYRAESNSLIGQPIKRMSKLTERLMQSIDYQKVAKKRRTNYLQLNQQLDASNLIHMELTPDMVPMVYPYVNADNDLRNYLISHKIFVARYWPNVIQRTDNNSIESQLTLQLQPLPIDQRYGSDEIDSIINKINSYVKR